MNTNKAKIQSLIKQILTLLGEDVKREGLIKTPERVAGVLEHITSGNKLSIKNAVNGALFSHDSANMILVKEIELYSTCEHHMLPFFGKCHIGYVAKEKIIGLSKIARVVNVFARRLQIQERLTEQIARAINDILRPEGIAVVIEAQHLCMMMRGVEKQNSLMTTSSMLGIFKDDFSIRTEFLALIGNNRK